MLIEKELENVKNLYEKMKKAGSSHRKVAKLAQEGGVLQCTIPKRFIRLELAANMQIKQNKSWYMKKPKQFCLEITANHC
jgi:hypothetical protein